MTPGQYKKFKKSLLGEKTVGEVTFLFEDPETKNNGIRINVYDGARGEWMYIGFIRNQQRVMSLTVKTKNDPVILANGTKKRSDAVVAVKQYLKAVGEVYD